MLDSHGIAAAVQHITRVIGDIPGIRKRVETAHPNRIQLSILRGLLRLHIGKGRRTARSRNRPASISRLERICRICARHRYHTAISVTALPVFTHSAEQKLHSKIRFRRLVLQHTVGIVCIDCRLHITAGGVHIGHIAPSADAVIAAAGISVQRNHLLGIRHAAHHIAHILSNRLTAAHIEDLIRADTTASVLPRCSGRCTVRSAVQHIPAVKLQPCRIGKGTQIGHADAVALICRSPRSTGSSGTDIYACGSRFLCLLTLFFRFRILRIRSISLSVCVSVIILVGGNEFRQCRSRVSVSQKEYSPDDTNAENQDNSHTNEYLFLFLHSLTPLVSNDLSILP